LVTVRSFAPSEADRLIDKDVVNCVEETTVTDPAVIPVPALTLVAPATKSVPVIVIDVDFPRGATTGETAVILGTGLLTVKPPVRVVDPPPGDAFVTETSRAPPEA
jgi:hypothetical protein